MTYTLRHHHCMFCKEKNMRHTPYRSHTIRWSKSYIRKQYMPYT